MIRRTFDPSLINTIANLPGVREKVGAHLAPDVVIDFGDVIGKPSDYIILTNGVDAAAMFERRNPSVLDGHTVFGPTCRGRDAIRTGRAILDWIFTNTSALIVCGSTPSEFKEVCWFNRQIGFSSDGIETRTNQYWTHEFEHFHLTRQEWEKRRIP